MRKASVLLFILGYFIVFSAKSAEVVGGGSWKDSMHTLYKDAIALIPYAFDPAKYDDPKNAAQISKHLASLKKNAGVLKTHAEKMLKEEKNKIDPSYPFIAESFAMDMAFAEQSFEKLKDPERSAGYLRMGISKCMACHSQTGNGPFLNDKMFTKEISDLNGPDRVIALVSTRQFDSAINEFGQYVTALKVKKDPNPGTFDLVARSIVSVLIRVKEDPAKLLEVLDKAIDSDAGTNMFKREVKDWRQDAIVWAAEKNSKELNDNDLFNKANKLIDEAKEKEFAKDGGKSGVVPFLRATALLHKLVVDFPQSKLRPKAYLLIATAYDSLPGFAIWDMAEEYLSACITENPHSEIAEKCYDRYSESLLIGYTGSSGLHMPTSVRIHMEDMRRLSQRKSEPDVKK